MISSKEEIQDVVAILPAAGIGKRMNYSFPKQYLTIGNKSILEYAIDMLLKIDCIQEIIVAINVKDIWFHKLSISKNKKIKTVFGGDSRRDSVISALSKTKGNKWVLIHDSVRPCLHYDDLQKLLNIRTYTDIGGILVTPVRDTIKKGCTNKKLIEHTIQKENLWHALTPQLFSYDLLSYCLKQAIIDGIDLPDDSSALEHYGYKPELVLGRADNIKVTYREDLEIARSFLFSKNISNAYRKRI